MKTDDIFEAFTDIDDKFIAAAHPTDFNDDPVVVYPAPRKPLWKTLVPIAACLAVIGTAGAFGAKYIKERISVKSPENTAMSNGLSDDLSPAGIILDFEEITVPKAATTENEFTMEEYPDYTFKALYDKVLLNDNERNAFGVPIFSATGYVNDLFLYDLNGDGKRELCVTLENNGVRSVEILDLASGFRYTPSDEKSVETYLQVDRNVDVQTLMMYERLDGGDGMLEGSGALSLSLMTCIIPETSAPVQINNMSRFELTEFPDMYFINLFDGKVLKSSKQAGPMKSEVASGDEFFVADLNGDGKRELVTQMCKSANDHVEIQVTAYDIANGDTYFKAFAFREFKWPVAEVVKIVDGKLVLRNYDEQNETKFDISPLTLDMLEKQAKPEFVKIPLYYDQTFYVSFYEGFEFTVDTKSVENPSFSVKWDSHGAAGSGLLSAYLCDLDGDNVPEIISYTRYYGELGGIKILGRMENYEMGSVVYVNNEGCHLAEHNGKLVCVANDGTEKPLEFSKSDLKPVFMNGYDYEIVNWDHTIDLSELLPPLAKYDIRVKQKQLSISLGGEEMFNSEQELSELYSIPDLEHDRIVYVFTLSDGKVGAVTITENDVEYSPMGDGLSLKPTADALMVVDKNGNETPFA